MSMWQSFGNLFKEFFCCLPFKEYIHPTIGSLNLSIYLPETSVLNNLQLSVDELKKKHREIFGKCDPSLSDDIGSRPQEESVELCKGHFPNPGCSTAGEIHPEAHQRIQACVLLSSSGEELEVLYKSCNGLCLPENVGQCCRLTEEFRTLPSNHRASEDKLKVKKMIVHAVCNDVKEILVRMQSLRL
ncbi:hypothetical protein M0R45_026574 [Rubus argutus]|uniref:Uncharacterized protein n=1 Tax=Rubus argutus TaxID=59490 RepID=A0AAW1WZP9_RUBAR